MWSSTSTTGRAEANTVGVNNEVNDETAEACDSMLRVLGKFELIVGSKPADPSANCRRLLTLLAIRDCQVSRASAAGTLWPDATTARANANLRSVLWKLQRSCPEVVEASFHVIRLAPDVCVDIKEVGQVARSLLDRSATRTPGGLSEALNCNLHEDIVPDLGDEEWLVCERERHRQLRLHALESLSEDLIVVGWHGAAVETALSVIRVDPFRESARQLLVRAYLAEGNQLEAHRQHREYRILMRRELGMEPTDKFLKLVHVPDIASMPQGRPRPVPHRQPARPVAQPVRPAAQPVRPTAQPVRPAAQPVRPAAQPVRPTAQPVRPNGQPVRPTAQPVRPNGQPVRPNGQPVRPAAGAHRQPVRAL